MSLYLNNPNKPEFPTSKEYLAIILIKMIIESVVPEKNVLVVEMVLEKMKKYTRWKTAKQKNSGELKIFLKAQSKLQLGGRNSKCFQT